MTALSLLILFAVFYLSTPVNSVFTAADATALQAALLSRNIKSFVSKYLTAAFYLSQPVNSAYTATDATALQAALLSSYSSKVRPSATTVVDVTLGMMHITELNIVQQQLHAVGFIVASWTDSRLVWEAVDYGNMESTHILLKDIWSPPLLLNNAADQIKMMNDDSDLSSVNVHLSNDGSIVWLAPANLIAQCTINIMYYPFDSQNCDFVISSWLFEVSDVNLGGSGSSINRDLYEENGEWDLTRSSVENKTRSLLGHPMPAVHFTTYLTRKYSYYLMNMILPVVTLAFMEPFVFMLPIESGEKIGYALTILLSLSVVMTLVSESVPPTSTPVCILSVYLLTTFITCSLETLLTVVICRIHDFHLKGFSMGPKQQTLAWILAKVTVTRSTKIAEQQKTHGTTQKNMASSVSEVKMKESKQLSKEIKKSSAWSEDENDEKEENAVQDYTYDEMAVLLDKFNFIVFSIVTFVVTLVFLVVLRTGGTS